jgi:lipopolysaccharide biosynthesis regulator YciM
VSLEYLLALLVALPVAWVLGWMMAMRYLKVKTIVELNQLRKSLKESQNLIVELNLMVQKATEQAEYQKKMRKRDSRSR